MDTQSIALGLLALGIAVAFYFIFKPKKKWLKPSNPFPKHWKTLLLKKVSFYAHLDEEDRKQFEFKVQEFLLNHTITGVEVEVDDTDRLLIASSAVIPVFRYPEWNYTNLEEVLLYPRSFNEDFQFDKKQKDRQILGMVGTGYMEGKMILSKQALLQGFLNETDKQNTAIHEFVHLIDKMDGWVDGVPSVLMEKQYIIPWLDMIAEKMKELRKGGSGIDSYAQTSKVEFFAVVSEYFFERPELLKRKHPKLYKALSEVFKQP